MTLKISRVQYKQYKKSDHKNSTRFLLRLKTNWLYFWNPIKYLLKGDVVLGQNYWILYNGWSGKFEIGKMCITKGMKKDLDKLREIDCEAEILATIKRKL